MATNLKYGTSTKSQRQSRIRRLTDHSISKTQVDTETSKSGALTLNGGKCSSTLDKTS